MRTPTDPESPAEEVITDRESVASAGLPPGITLQNPRTGLYRMMFNRGKRYWKTGRDIQELVAWRAAMEKTLDDANIPPAKVFKAVRQSKHPGVMWNKSASKWRGQIPHRITGKREYTRGFPGTDEGEAQCAKAVEVLRARLAAEFYTRSVAERDKSEATKGLPLAPKLADAVPGTVYAQMCKQSGWTAYRAVKIGDNKYARACLQCNQKAYASVKGVMGELCSAHGGGGAYKCPHGRERLMCRQCNPNILKMEKCCSNCGTGLSAKRKASNGGNGFCAACENHFRAEAAENGADGDAVVQPSQRWEDIIFEQLLPRIVDAAGRAISSELRDDFSNAIGSLYEESIDGGGRRLRKRKRGATDCHTTTYRRPDCLFVVRNAEARIVAALSIEVDEDCHKSRKFACELGKVDDTFQALQNIAAGEGASAVSHSGVRHDAKLILCQTFKFNPNACDVSPKVELDDRITVLANECNAFLSRSPTEYIAMSEAGSCIVPHVKCFYYHSKAHSNDEEPQNYLKAYAAIEPQWVFGGNVLVGPSIAR